MRTTADRGARTSRSAAWAGLAALLAITVFAGDSVPWVGLAALLLALGLGVPVLLGRSPRPLIERFGLAGLGLLAAFVVWNGLSVIWTVRPERTWDYLNLGLVYLAFAAAGVLVSTKLAPGSVASAFAAVLGAVAVWALAGKVFPGLAPDYERVARLRAPVGYWNALALLGDFALPLGLWVARCRRVAGALLIYGWTVAILLALSRGGVLVAAVVVGLWLLFDDRRLASVGTLALGALPGALVAAVAFQLDGITEDGQSAAVRAHDGRVFGLVVLLGAVTVAIATRLASHVELSDEHRRRTGRVLGIAVAACAVLAVVVVALNAGRIWDGFVGSSPVGSGSGRIQSVGSNYRLTWWKQAWHGFGERPVAGSGAGSFEYWNLRLRTSNVDQTLEPHDLPVQFLAETGLVGFLLVAGAAVFLAVAILRRLRTEPERAAAAALALIPLAYVLHGLLDYDWDFAAVTGPAVVAAAVLVSRPGPSMRRSSLGLVLVVAGVLVVFVSLLLPWLAQRSYLDAVGEPAATAVERARTAHQLNPLAVDPLFVQADGQFALGNARRAWGLYLQAAQIAPDDKETWFRLGQFELLSLRCPRAALPHLERFTELDPQGAGGQLYRDALALVNSGAPRC